MSNLDVTGTQRLSRATMRNIGKAEQLEREARSSSLPEVAARKLKEAAEHRRAAMVYSTLLEPRS